MINLYSKYKNIKNYKNYAKIIREKAQKQKIIV